MVCGLPVYTFLMFVPPTLFHLLAHGLHFACDLLLAWYVHMSMTFKPKILDTIAQGFTRILGRCSSLQQEGANVKLLLSRSWI